MVAAAPSQQATRHARRIYVGGLPPTSNEQNIATFFSNALAAVGGTTAGPGLPPLACCVVPCHLAQGSSRHERQVPKLTGLNLLHKLLSAMRNA